METAVAVMVVLAATGWGLILMWKKGIANFWKLLGETNARYGTSFGTSPRDRATIIGISMYKGGVLAFDENNRKIAYLSKGGKSVDIVGYNFVQSWRVTWTEKTVGGGAQFGPMAVGSANTKRDNVLLEITTNDINRPMLKMPMSSVHYAEETAARLKIMINAKA